MQKKKKLSVQLNKCTVSFKNKKRSSCNSVQFGYKTPFLQFLTAALEQKGTRASLAGSILYKTIQTPALESDPNCR